MLGEVNLNGDLLTNKQSDKQNQFLTVDRMKLNQLIEEISNSLEEYFSEAVDSIQNQIKLLEEKEKLSPKNDLTLDRLNLIISKIISINRQKLNEKFKSKLDNVKMLIKTNQFYLISNQNDENIQSNELLEIDKFIDFDLFLAKIKILLQKFDEIFLILKRNLNSKKSIIPSSSTSCLNIKNNYNNNNKLLQKYTDFSSDTEILYSSKKINKKILKKIFNGFKNFYLTDDESSSSMDSSSDEEDARLNHNYSDTDLNNISLSYSDLEKNYSQDSDNSAAQDSNDDYYYADEDSNDSYETAESSLSDNMDQDLSQLYKIFDEQDEAEKEPEQNLVNNQQEDDDCIIISENDSDKQTQQNSAKKINKCLDLIQKLIISNKESKFRAPIQLGMKVLALKDKTKYKWKLARIMKISDNNLLTNENQTSEPVKSEIIRIHKIICNCKYYVLFDSDTEDDQEDNKSNQDDNLNILNVEQHESEYSEEENLIYKSSSNDEAASETESKNMNKKRKQKSSRQEGPFVKKRTSLNLSGSHLIELDSKSIAFLDNYDKYLPSISFNSITNTVLFPARSRIVTLYQLKISTSDKTKVLFNQEYMSSGTIIEVPSVSNYHRYLVMFDNGLTSYVKPNLLFPIFDLFGMPNEMLDIDHVKYLSHYFKLYPERSMVRLNPNDVVRVYLHPKWYNCRVLDVDCSLVQLELKNNFNSLFKFRNNINNPNFMNALHGTHSNLFSIKLFRGSFSLYPLYDQLMNRINSFGKTVNELSLYEQYVKEKKENSSLNINQSNKYISLFASSIFPSVSSKNRFIKQKPNHNLNNFNLNPRLLNNNEYGSSNSSLRVIQGQIKHLDMESLMRNEIINFVPHPCTNACVAKWETNFSRVRWVNPLLVPVLHGWQRHICHQSKTINSASKKWINYLSPCGRMLRSTSEVDRYLYLTNSLLTIDMFSFDHFIHTDREYEANAKYLKIEDISNKQENAPISVVNCVDTSRPDEFEYSAKRIALDGVPLNTDPKLMEGCNCTDNCRDRSKCACWRKTFEATLFTSSDNMNTNLGYRGRRLPDLVSTGIFECNSNCKCDCRCSNRVVQNGISVRLQLFKTHNFKGWGLRCLDDIPKGTFICTYAGHLLTEEQSDERGKVLGDEYFAELDFVECLRQLKTKIFCDNNTESNFEEDENSSNDATSFKSKSNRRQNSSKADLNSDHYQRPKQQQHQVKKQYLGLNETDYIFLDSDEDEQDRNENLQLSDLVIQSPISKKEDDYKKRRVLNRQQKEKSVATSINSNRFFTNRNNTFFYENFLKNSNVFIMDAKTCGNIGRYFNHSCSPNIFVQNVFVDTYDLRFPWISFFALNSIKAGTELCWDYNYTIGSVKDRVLLCHCNSASCRGRLL